MSNIYLKSGLSPSKRNFFLCFNDSLSKVMKIAFYFVLKVFFVLKIFHRLIFSRFLDLCGNLGLPWLLVMYKKRLDWKEKVNFEIYDVTAWLIKNYNTHIAQHLTN